MAEWMKNALANVVVIGGVLALMAWMQARDAEQRNELASADCRPSDINEIAIQTIEGGRVMCEKHQRIRYAQASTMACPIKHACDKLKDYR